MTINSSKIILDSDFVIACYLNSDSNHKKALEIYDKYDEFVILNLNLYEIATVLSRLLSQDEAIQIFNTIYEDLENIIINFDRDWEKEIIYIYNSSKNKNISFIDCSILSLAQKNSYKIASFDKFYPPEYLIN